jgi:hypothetical protein
MYSPDQTKNFQSAGDKETASEKVPNYGVKEYLERASSFYYKQDKPKDEAGYLTLLQDINAHVNKGENWKDDEYLVGKIERFINERFENFIAEKQAAADEDGVRYYQERLKLLLEDLCSKE